MRYQIKAEEFNDPIFDLTPNGFLRKYKKQIVESNMDKNVKNYILETMKEYDNNLFVDKFNALYRLLILFLQFTIYPDRFGSSFGYSILHEYDLFKEGLSSNEFKQRLKKELEHYKKIAKHDFINMYRCYDNEDIIDGLLDKVTYKLLSNSSIYARVDIIYLINSVSNTKYHECVY